MAKPKIAPAAGSGPPPGGMAEVWAKAKERAAAAEKAATPESADQLKQRRLRELAEFARKERLDGAEKAAEVVTSFEKRQNETRAERIARLKAGLKQLE